MLISGGWFQAITALLSKILLFTTRYRPPWWFWSTSNSHQSVGSSKKQSKSRYRTIEDVPGPLALPWFGTRWIYYCFLYRINKLHDAYKVAESIAESIYKPRVRVDLNRRYGPLLKEEAFWNYPVISIFSRQDIEMLLKRGSKYPLRPPQDIISDHRRSRPDRYTNLGLVNENGETWHRLRAALTPKLMSSTTVLGFFPALNEVTDDFINLIRLRRSGDDVRGFEELAYNMGLESTCTLILGRHLGFLKPDTASILATRLAEAVRNHFTASRDASYCFPLWKLRPTPASRKLTRSEDDIYTIITELLETTICKQEDTARDEGVEAVFQSILRHKNLDIRDKKAAIVDFIAAGIHTLGNTLVFVFNLIGRHQEVQKLLHEEVKILAPAGCDITCGNLLNAKYLRACITESFRVIPTVPCIARILDEPAELSGYYLTSGTVVLLQTWIAGMDEKNFKDASKWMPERWIEPPTPHSPLLVAPFGSGRRICPGKRFVEQALQLIIAKVVREFEIVAEEELDLMFEYIIAPKGPVSLIFRDRKEDV